jgi:hypothetical protein
MDGAGLAKWRLAQVTLFFDTIILFEHLAGYRPMAEARGEYNGKLIVGQQMSETIEVRADISRVIDATQLAKSGTGIFRIVARRLCEFGTQSNVLSPQSGSIRRLFALSLHLCCFNPPHQIVSKARKRPFEGLAAFTRGRTIRREGLPNGTNGNRT